MVEEPESQTRRDLTRDARVLRLGGSRFKCKISVATSNGSYAE